jgi:hypothetical protein
MTGLHPVVVPMNVADAGPQDKKYAASGFNDGQGKRRSSDLNQRRDRCSAM